MGDRPSADSLRWNLDLVLDQRGADMADLPGGASGLLVRDYKRKNADRLVTRIGPRGGLAGRSRNLLAFQARTRRRVDLRPLLGDSPIRGVEGRLDGDGHGSESCYDESGRGLGPICRSTALPPASPPRPGTPCR